MPGYTSVTVEAALQIPGISVEVIEYQWDRVTDSTRMSPDHQVVKRIWPHRLETRLRIGDRNFIRGALGFTPAEITVSSCTVGARAKFAQCRFSRERFDPLIGRGRKWDAADLEHCVDLRIPAIDQAIDRLVAEAGAPGFASDILVDALGVTIMVELSRHFDKWHAQQPKISGGLAPWQMRRLTEYVESCSDMPVTSSDIAALCGVSNGHLRRAFKQTTGRTLHEYVEQTRLGRATALLTTTDRPLKRIAGELGFASASGFAIAFKRASGETPGGFRRRMRNPT